MWVVVLLSYDCQVCRPRSLFFVGSGNFGLSGSLEPSMNISVGRNCSAVNVGLYYRETATEKKMIHFKEGHQYLTSAADRSPLALLNHIV